MFWDKKFWRETQVKKKISVCISQLEDDDEAIRASSLIIFPLIDVIYKYETDVGVIALLKEHTKSKLPSKLWISATSHIASKCFSIEKSQITRHLSQILCHLIYDYPYHVLHTILMYDDEKNASKVKGFLKTIFDARADQRDSSKLKEIVITIREAHQAYRYIRRLNFFWNFEKDEKFDFLSSLQKSSLFSDNFSVVVSNQRKKLGSSGYFWAYSII